MAVRRSRLQLLGPEDVDLDLHESPAVPTPEEQVATFDRLASSAEAFQRLKPHEVRALWLKAQGLSYEEIAKVTGWSYTKVFRPVCSARAARAPGLNGSGGSSQSVGSSRCSTAPIGL